MSKILALASLLVCSNLIADIQFDPNKLSSEKSRWYVSSGQYKGEFFEDIVHEGKVVFRILARFMPMFDSMVQDAIARKGVLNYRNYGNISHSSAETITNNFYVTDSPRHLVMTQNPEKIVLSKKPGLIWDDYQVIFDCDNSVYEVTKEVFEDLRRLITVAKSKKLNIRIDLNAMLEFPRDELNLNSCFWLVEQSVSGEIACTLCLNNPKDTIMRPCNHLCACADCARQVKLNCPICRQPITAKDKVYW